MKTNLSISFNITTSLFLFFSFSCNSQAEKNVNNNEGVIEKKQVNVSQKKQSNLITFIVEDSQVDYNKAHLSFYSLDSLSNAFDLNISKKVTNLEIDQPVVLCKADSKQNLYYVEPNDSVFIRIDKLDNTTLFIKNNTTRTRELAFFTDLIEKFGRIYNYIPANTGFFAKKLPTSTFEEKVKKIDKTFTDRLTFLNTEYKADRISNNFFNVAYNIIRSSSIKDSLYEFSRNQTKRTRLQFIQFLDNKSSNLNQLSFNNNLVFSNALDCILSLYLNNTLNAGLKSLEDYKKRNEIIKLKFSGLTRDYLLSTNYLNFFKLNNKINEFIKSDYSNVCSSLSFKNKVFGITEKTSQIISSDNLDNLFSYKYNSYFKIKNLIDSKKGKLILIDNWASWCRPCRAEMEASQKLYSNLDPSKISFVYLSEDSDNDSWQKAIKQDNLTEMENYKYADISASSFIKQFNITTIPRYILIGKDGKVISADAPRPSDPKLKALIDKYINQ